MAFLNESEATLRVVPRARLERATCGLEVRCSIQLSYRGMLSNKKIRYALRNRHKTAFTILEGFR